MLQTERQARIYWRLLVYKIDYRRINIKLSKSFGKGNVKLIPDPERIREFVLWFRDEDVGFKTMKRAVDIVNEIEPYDFFWNEIRVTGK